MILGGWRYNLWFDSLGHGLDQVQEFRWVLWWVFRGLKLSNILKHLKKTCWFRWFPCFPRNLERLFWMSPKIYTNMEQFLQEQFFTRTLEDAIAIAGRLDAGETRWGLSSCAVWGHQHQLDLWEGMLVVMLVEVFFQCSTMRLNVTETCFLMRERWRDYGNLETYVYQRDT